MSRDSSPRSDGIENAAHRRLQIVSGRCGFVRAGGLDASVCEQPGRADGLMTKTARPGSADAKIFTRANSRNSRDPGGAEQDDDEQRGEDEAVEAGNGRNAAQICRYITTKKSANSVRNTRIRTKKIGRKFSRGCQIFASFRLQDFRPCKLSNEILPRKARANQGGDRFGGGLWKRRSGGRSRRL